ncbi:M23 family metallopeptidase [Pseudoclavibacter sp. RFBA6]|uniref:M23 family metallopeptidase n=1 Tax=Pseudoclavibacter sp. RFBA6 TaxID=2080573 RepID=UPI000CE75942|nr:M23 family metallopeptidase [Pseudoclavibacter sp. RFBA6]PPG39473.1 hypothetical protein C5C17_11830 [Pseudoclavibacter sp. RFBA6]
MQFEWPFHPDDVVIPQGGEFGPRPSGPELADHFGMDLNAPAGSLVRAAAAGTVTVTRRDGADDEGEGNSVWLRHDDRLQTRYLHLDELLVEQGDVVELGQPIGTVGQTGNASGPHLCFMTLFYGVAFNPRTFMRDRALEATSD